MQCASWCVSVRTRRIQRGNRKHACDLRLSISFKSTLSLLSPGFHVALYLVLPHEHIICKSPPRCVRTLSVCLAATLNHPLLPLTSFSPPCLCLSSPTHTLLLDLFLICLFFFLAHHFSLRLVLSCCLSPSNKLLKFTSGGGFFVVKVTVSLGVFSSHYPLFPRSHIWMYFPCQSSYWQHGCGKVLYHRWWITQGQTQPASFLGFAALPLPLALHLIVFSRSFACASNRSPHNVLRAVGEISSIYWKTRKGWKGE